MKQGSTCALTESILRNLNVKTGLYTSPFLIKRTEQICLNGEPISEEKYAEYFWTVYDTLENKKVKVK